MGVLNINDFSGGLFLAEVPDDPADNQCLVYSGVDKACVKGLRTREGSPVIHAHNADSLFYWRLYWYYGIGGVLYRNGGTVSADNSALSSEPFDFVTAVSSPIGSPYVYACNSAAHATTTTCWAVGLSGNARRWGIQAPSTALSGTATTGGAMDTSSQYTYVFTFYNGSTGCESNPSSSFTLSTGAAQNATSLTSIDVSSDSQVTDRYLYRTVGDGGVLFYLDNVGNNSSTTYSDTLGDSSLDTTKIVSYNNLRPGYFDGANNFRAPHFHGVTMFWLNGTTNKIYYSRPSYPESVEGFIRVGTDDADYPLKLFTFGGELYAVTTYGVYNIYGDNPWYSRLLGGILGTTDKRSVVSSPYGVFWVASDGVRIFTGGSQSLIAGGKALENAFMGNATEGISPILNYTNYATWCKDEYIFGNSQNTLAYNPQLNRWRELDLELKAIHYDPDANVCGISCNSNVCSLETSGYTDGGANYQFEFKTKVFKFADIDPNVEGLVQIKNISVSANKDAAQSVSVYAYFDNTVDLLGSLNANTGRRTSDFDPDAITPSIQLRIVIPNVATRVEIFNFRIEYEPLLMRVIGDDPIDIPANFESGSGTIAFNFRDGKAQEACKLYRYDLLNIDIDDNNNATALNYTQVGGSNTLLETIQNNARSFNQYELTMMGPMQRIYLTATWTLMNVHIYDITMHRTAVRLYTNLGDFQSETFGYLDGSRTSVKFNVEVSQSPPLNKVYLFDRITLYGNPYGSALTAYIDLLDEAAVSLGAKSTTGNSYYNWDVDKMGICEQINFTGTFSPTGSLIYKAELIGRPITLTCRFGDETFKIDGYVGSASAGIFFDLTGLPDAVLEQVYYFERLTYDMHTEGGNATFSFYFVYSSGSPLATTGNINSATRIVGSYQLDMIGRLERVYYSHAVELQNGAIYNLELTAVPLTLDLYLDDQLHRIPGYFDTYVNIYFDLNNLEESANQKSYYFETLYLEADTNSNAMTPYLTLVDNSEISFTGLTTGSRAATDIEMKVAGKLDKIRLNGTFNVAMSINRFEIEAHAIMLHVYLAGEMKQIPGRFRNAGGELFFDLKPMYQDSVQQIYSFEKLLLEGSTNSITVTPKITLCSESEASLSTFSSATKRVFEIAVNKTGRLDALRFTGALTQYVYLSKIELIACPVLLDVYLDDQKTSVNGYLDGSDNIRFDLSPLNETSAQRIYIFERFLAEADTNSVTMTPYITFCGEAEDTLSTFSSSSKEVDDITVQKTGRLDSFRIASIFSEDIYLNKLELIGKTLQLDVYLQDQKQSFEAYMDSAGNIQFDLSPLRETQLNQAYAFEKLLLEGDTSSITVTPYLTMCGEAESVLGDTFSSASKTTKEIDVYRTGRLDKIRFASSFTPDVYISKIELFAKPVMLDVIINDQTKKISGYLDGSNNLRFDLSPLEESNSNQVYLFERLLVDADTDSNTLTPYINFVGEAEDALSTFVSASREVDVITVNKCGRLNELRLSGFTTEDIFISKIELIVKPLVMDVYLNDQKTSVGGYLDSAGNINFDLSPLAESTSQQAYLFERLLLDGDTNSVTVTPHITLVEGAEFSLSTFDVSTRTVDDKWIGKIGRLDKLRLASTFDPDVYFHKIELIAHPITLDLWVNGELKQIPGRLRSSGGTAAQEMYFDFYPHLQEPLYTRYIVHNFFYDIFPDENRMVFDLQLVGESDQELLDTSSASRITGEVHITRPGRPSNLTIESDFTALDQAIYKLELEIQARRGLTNRGKK